MPISREEMLKILSLVAQAKKEAGEPVSKAYIISEDKSEVIDFESENEDLPN